MSPSARVRPRPGPKPRLSRRMIVQAAVRIGVEDISVQAVAAELGVSVASLYRYVDSRDDLVLAAVAAIIADTPLPDRNAGWRAYLETEAAIRWELLTRYLGLLPENAGALAATATRRLDRLVHDLRALGFDLDAAVLAVDAVVDLVQDGVTQTRGLRDPDNPGQLAPTMVTSMSVCSPDVRAAVHRIVDAPRDHVWRKLALLLDGISGTLAPADARD